MKQEWLKNFVGSKKNPERKMEKINPKVFPETEK